ncbi:DUF1838 family protein [Dactylosporangium roseum]|uniref:DUF1838 family protein n=1 Tax=Dactylosporangium roseum TaxID=47989 RepID=A0ABY5ZHD1_9ACTN|nr:DUF1838 family protein [Dactylosporangium roseum]
MTPEQQLQALAKTRAAIDGREVTVWWSGDVYAWGPEQPYLRLFGFEGFNVARLVRVAGGYEMLAREAAFYLDPRDREILTAWHNPFTGETVDVLHVWNDPVNQRWLLDGPRGPFQVSITPLGDQVCFNLDIPLAYPSPLPVAAYPDSSADDTYRALELFHFYAPAEVLTDEHSASFPHVLSWARMSPWLPWMRMGSRPGGLAFHCRGMKLDRYTDMPHRTQAYVAAHAPHYATAPESWTEPNETSWTYFRKLAGHTSS